MPDPGTDIVDGQVIDVETTAAPTPPAITIHVAGEHLPDQDPERGARVQGGALVPVHRPTIDDILAAFQAWMRLDVADGNASPETLRCYLGDVRQHLVWLDEEGITPAQAGEEDIKAYRAHLIETYAVASVGRKLTAVRRFYQMAHNRGAVAHNPADGVKAPRDKTARHERVKYLTQVALQRLLAAPDTHTPKGLRDRAILVLMAIHGLRAIEVHRANLEDLDLEAGEAGSLRVFGKGDKWRTVLLTEQTREELKKWLAVRSLMQAADDQALFVSMHWSNGRSQPGRRVSRRGIRRMVDGYLEATGAKQEGISCHALRHSFATHSLNNGAELLAISVAMGHASVVTTQVYVELLEKAKKNPAKFLIGLLD